ncbi:MAG: histidine phosphatase family protein [Gammaproteobacteria bacterium]|nr:histidine phosphatase family protein [Gammaproteobacteria bacterium]
MLECRHSLLPLYFAEFFITPLTTTRFFLARHGETQWNKQQKLQGQLDSPLTQNGINQANQLAKSLTSYDIELIVSSPLPRALLTAEIIQQQLLCRQFVDEQLMERHFGQWQGMLMSEAKLCKSFNDIFLDVTNLAPPQGESAQESAKRFHNSLINIANNSAKTNILVVSHGDILRSFLSFYLAFNFPKPSDELVNCCIFAIDYHQPSNTFSVVTND